MSLMNDLAKTSLFELTIGHRTISFNCISEISILVIKWTKELQSFIYLTAYVTGVRLFSSRLTFIKNICYLSKQVILLSRNTSHPEKAHYFSFAVLTWKHLNNGPLPNQTNGTRNIVIVKCLDVAFKTFCLIFCAINVSFVSFVTISVHSSFRIPR